MSNVIPLWPVKRTVRNEIQVPDSWRKPISHFLTTLKLGGSPKPTITLRSYHLRRFAADCGVGPWQVTIDDILVHIARSAWSPSMTKTFRSTMRGFYGWAKTSHRIKKNPAKHMPVVRVPQGTPRPASDPVVFRAFASADERLRLMLRLASELGMRCREIALSHHDDLSRDETGWTLVVHGKGSKDRMMPLSDNLGAELDARAGWFFPGNIDGHLSPAYVSKLISRHMTGATAHQLRHRFATRAYQNGGHDIRAVQQLLGHASVATTQIYVAPERDALRRVMSAAA